MPDISERTRLMVDLAAIVMLAGALWVSRPLIEVAPEDRVGSYRR